MDITTLDLTARLAAKKATAKMQQKLASKRNAISAKREQLKAELKTTTPTQ